MNTNMALAILGSVFAIALIVVFIFGIKQSKSDFKKIGDGIDSLADTVETLQEQVDFYVHTLQAIELAAQDLPAVEGYERVQLQSLRSHLKRVRNVARDALNEYDAGVLGEDAQETAEPTAQ
jgi:uncharacterized membrane protein